MFEKMKKEPDNSLAAQLKKGYAEMADINLEIAQSCLSADNEALEMYEKLLAESEH